MALDSAQELAPDWKRYFLLLNDRDLRAPVRDEVQRSEGRLQYSWIWTTPLPPPFPLTTTPNGIPQATTSAPLPPPPAPASLPLPPTPIVPATNNTDSDVVNQDFERVQWAKSQARAERYEEEVQLTVEEMGRTLRYFEWKRDWWLSLVPGHTKSGLPPDIRAGLRAYAYRQSDLYDDLVTSYVSRWRPYLSAKSLGSSWLDGYASRVSLIPTPSSWKVDARLPSTCAPILTPSSLPIDPQPVDPPIRSESDDEADWDDDETIVGDVDEYVDTEDILDDD